MIYTYIKQKQTKYNKVFNYNIIVNEYFVFLCMS